MMPDIRFRDLWEQATGAQVRVVLLNAAGLDIDLVFCRWYELSHLERQAIQARTLELQAYLNRLLPEKQQIGLAA
ncbi:hypothetical protein [Rhodocyclus gracilis]|uniref:Uncharacterized protein n=1 Tax=Rhodocyclus tenuis TaxID=1066 RepID=A0A6L5JTW0_RHOTE|nr:hypothetical protein [Rhodocyclus gracilis]MQY50845.1 hypothetical protein [Rhodocyclus gracilis]